MNTAPESFLCPITQDVMRDPVICPDGYTYEKDAIKLHLHSSPLSPMTRQAVDTNAMIPNRALKDAIAEWLNANPEYVIKEKVTPAVNNAGPMQYAVTLQLQDAACSKNYDQDVLCMIVDVSGSMSSAPVLKDLSGAAIAGANLTKLEMVRHAIKVAVTSLPLGTHIGIMAYDHDVSALVPFTQIASDADRVRIIKEVSKMETHGCTDIYKALEFGAMATIKYCDTTKMVRRDASKKMWLLTDGLPYSPNMPVKKGPEIIEGFEFLSSTNKLVKELQVSTFGFGSGNQIETDALEKLARMTGGSFGYIPDPSMLACNINGRNANDVMSISNEVVDVSFPKGYSMECIGGSVVKESTTDDSRVVSIKLRGAFKKGIPRHVYFTLFKVPGGGGSSSSSGADDTTVPSLSCTVNEARLTSKVDELMSLDALKTLLNDGSLEDTHHANLTLPVLCAFLNALSKKSADMIDQLIDFVNIARAKMSDEGRDEDSYLLAIMHDAKEGKKACNPQYWDAWGKHYLRALLSAYECEESLSSRDLGTIELFVNKSNDMKNAVATMESKFKSLAIQSTRKISQATVARYADARSSGCFTPATLVKMADGSFLPIGSLAAGMMVMSQPIQCGSSQTRGTFAAKIMTVVETKLIGEGTQEVVQVCEGAFATPYHPVKTTLDNGPGGWVFPKDMSATGNQTPGSFTSVFDLVLDKSHTIFIGDGSAQAITMAHSYEHGVLKHPFFGTRKCLDHMYSLYPETVPPHVVIKQGSFVREVTPEDPDGQIVGVLAPMVAVC